MKTKIINAKIVDENFEIKQGNILIENNIISKISENDFDENIDKIIDAKNNLILPGFINAHAHSAMIGLKGCGGALEEWLFENILQKESKLTENDVYYLTLYAILMYLKNGITNFVDMYYFPKYIAKAVEKTKIRASICLGYNYLNCKTNYNELEKLYLELKNNELLNFCFSCHSTYVNSEDEFCDIIKLSKKYNKPVYTHASETLTEVGNITKQFNLTPIGLLEQYGFFDCKSIINHAVCLDKEDYDILQRYDVNVISNPASNLKLGSGIAPLFALKKKGVNLGLGTDGAASNDRLDMFREMYLAKNLQQFTIKNCEPISCVEVLKMATINNAKSLGYDNLGLIKEGFLADLIILDIHSLNYMGEYNILDNMINSGGVEDVLLTMVNGVVLYENGKFNINIDENKIKQKYLEIVKRIN